MTNLPFNRYLHALEERCHSTEALIGILLSILDRRATSLLSEISEDPFLRNVLELVNNSSFGLSGRQSVSDAHETLQSGLSMVVLFGKLKCFVSHHRSIPRRPNQRLARCNYQQIQDGRRRRNQTFWCVFVGGETTG